MDARKKEFTPYNRNLSNDDHFADRREEAHSRNRVVGEVIAQDDLNVRRGPHRAILQCLPLPARIGYACASPASEVPQ
jgi:hypothetical protein